MAARIVPKKKALILVMGVPGSGKTTLAKSLLQRMVCVYLDNNFVADAFYADSRTDPQYVRLRPRLYNVLYRITEENLEVGNSVLLDVPHVTHVQDPQWCSFIKELADRCNASLIVLRCRCSEECLRTRLSDRGKERDRWKLESWDEFAKREPIDVSIPFDHLDVETDVRTDTSVEQAWTYILARIS